MEMVGVFFFQAEDGIRDVAVTGVQTCALPISQAVPGGWSDAAAVQVGQSGYLRAAEGHAGREHSLRGVHQAPSRRKPRARSEERRVGKEGRSRWSPYH